MVSGTIRRCGSRSNKPSFGITWSTVDSKGRRTHKYDDDALIRSLRELFDVEWYRAQYPEVGQWDNDPLWHYLMRRATAEGRDPSPLFD